MDALTLTENDPTTQDTRVLRVVTAGSVDDGKSTLIGRLLLDSKGVFADQIKAITGSRYSRAPDQAVDLALLTDGLEAEREQGITIDVAYRYFATPTCKFIVADAPGHEQYTRNMITGASTADAAILLIDAHRVAGGQLLPQTKRHATLARLLGLRHVVIAVNKMDQVDWQQPVFERIRHACENLADYLGLPAPHCIPMSALQGDNVVSPSARMSWYNGPALLPLLESLPLEQVIHPDRTRFFVQWVIRHGGSGAQAFRGYAGQIQDGAWHVGDAVRVLPSGETARLRALYRGSDPLESAQPGDSITVVLDRDIDISRGDLIVDAQAQIELGRQFEAELCWLDRRPLDLNRWYWLKQGSHMTQARVVQTLTRRDISELRTRDWEGKLELNDIGRVSLETREPVALDDYDHTRATGAFILIDDATYQTAAAGMIRR